MSFKHGRFRSGDRSKYGKRHKPGVMNDTESEYAQMLEARRLAGEIVRWDFEAVTFKLADRCTFTPDFQVLLPDGTIDYVDVKGCGPVDPKSVVKIKVAAETFWMFKFVSEKKNSKKHGGGWTRTEY